MFPKTLSGSKGYWTGDRSGLSSFNLQKRFRDTRLPVDFGIDGGPSFYQKIWPCIFGGIKVGRRGYTNLFLYCGQRVISDKPL